MFEVHHYGFGMSSDYVVPQFFAGAGYMHKEVGAESTGQGPGHSRIVFQNNYTLSHLSPDLRATSTTDADIGLGLQGGRRKHNSTDI
jgi:hypothetical protein